MSASAPAIDDRAIKALRARIAEHNAERPADAPTVDLYARLSRNPLGELEKIETQLEDAYGVAVRQHWRVAEVWIDNSLSAWQRHVRRPGWEKLLERLEAGVVGGVVVYHQDRLMRRPHDLEKLIDVAETRGLLLASAHGSRDLTDPDQRFIARIEVAHACRSSDDTSRRTKRNFKRLREAGHMRNGGPRSFGFPGLDRTAEAGEREPVPEALVERERAALRQACDDIVRGVPLDVVAADWNAAGLLTATGRTWDGPLLRQVLTRPSNASLVEHNGVVVARSEAEPIVPEETYRAVMAVFSARRRGRPNGTYLGSGILECGRCGAKLYGRPLYRKTALVDPHQYHCMKNRGGCGRLSIKLLETDRLLRAFALDRLGTASHAVSLAAEAAEVAERLDAIAEELAATSRVQQALAERLGRGEIDLDTFDAAMRPMRERVARREEEREQLTAEAAATGSAAAQHRRSRAEVAAAWDSEEATTAHRRALLVAALRGTRVVVAPNAPGHNGRTYDHKRVAFLPRAVGTANG